MDAIIPNDAPIVSLDCREAFEGIGEAFQKYSHFLAKACWEGAPICLFQCSFESPALFAMFLKIFRTTDAAQLVELGKAAGIPEEDILSFITYAAAFFYNLGNFKSFGDTKFLPACPEASFVAIVKCAAAYREEPEFFDGLLEEICPIVYSLKDGKHQLGFPSSGITTYYSPNVLEADAAFVQQFMDEHHISAYNTRVYLKETEDCCSFRVLLASAEQEADKTRVFEPESLLRGKKVTIAVEQGDYFPFMRRIVDNLQKASEFAANEHQLNALKHYIESFRTGDLEEHVTASRHWIKDQGPTVESYIGFIESYRDPLGVRGEWEGFVAVVNERLSSRLRMLVEKSEQLLPLLPWGAVYEKDQFLKPDFTSLDVLTFASSGIPAGINIPNYDEVRQNDGFKNVSLGNVLAAAYGAKDRPLFLNDELAAMFKEYALPSFELQVGLHELLGHGSGKLFQQLADGSFNFDRGAVDTTGWYAAGETWSSKFADIASSYEECRAECVGMWLCYKPEVLSIFGHTDLEVGKKVAATNWLSFTAYGLKALEFYDPATRHWGQAHMMARFAIFRVLQGCEGLITIVHDPEGTEPHDRLRVDVNLELIETVGMAAIGTFLEKLQVFKAGGCGCGRLDGFQSEANVAAGREMFLGLCQVPEELLALRPEVMAQRKPRKMFVQPHTFMREDGSVAVKEFSVDKAGLIASFVERFGAEVVDDVLAMWGQQKKAWE